MGQTFIEAVQNNYGNTFSGSIAIQNCMYYVANLLTINEGANNIGIEYKNSGVCFGTTSYFVVAYALPGTPSDQFNWAIGLISTGFKLSLTNTSWQAQSLPHDGSIAYVWTLTDGVSVTLDSFPSGTITQTVNATSGTVASASLGEVIVSS